MLTIIVLPTVLRDRVLHIRRDHTVGVSSVLNSTRLTSTVDKVKSFATQQLHGHSVR